MNKSFLIIISLLFLLFAMAATASSYRQVDLQHQSADALAERLQDLVSDKVAVTTSGNSLLLRGPANELQSLSRLIKTWDKPAQQLRVSVYRGKQPGTVPNQPQQKRWSTDTWLRNRTDAVVITEGTRLRVTDEALIPVVTESALIKTDKDRFLTHPGPPASEPVQSVEEGYYQRKEYLPQRQHLELVASLLKGDQVAVTVTMDRPAQVVQPQSNGEINNDQEPAYAVTQTQLQRILPLNQWVELHQAQQQGHAALANQRQRLASTQKTTESSDGLWIKVERLSP